MLLLAQAITDPVSAWMSVVLQGGAFALIAYIVIFAYPKAAQSLREEREGRDKLFLAMIDALQVKQDARNIMLANSVERQTTLIVQAVGESAARIEAAVDKSCRATLSNIGPRPA